MAPRFYRLSGILLSGLLLSGLWLAPLWPAHADSQSEFARKLSHAHFPVRASAALALSELDSLRPETIHALVNAMEASVRRIQIEPAEILQREDEAVTLITILNLLRHTAPEQEKFLRRLLRLSTGTTGASSARGRLLLEQAASEAEIHLSDLAKNRPELLEPLCERGLAAHRLEAIRFLAAEGRVTQKVLKSLAALLESLPNRGLGDLEIATLALILENLGARAVSLAPIIRTLLDQPKCFSELSARQDTGAEDIATWVFLLTKALVQIDPLSQETFTLVQRLYSATVIGGREPEIREMILNYYRLRDARAKRRLGTTCSGNIADGGNSTRASDD